MKRFLRSTAGVAIRSWLVTAVAISSILLMDPALAGTASVAGKNPSEATAAPAAPRSQASESEPEGGTSTSESEPWEDEGHGNRHGDDKFAMGSDVVIHAGQTQRGDVVCIGGKATIEGSVLGDVVVVGGTLDLSGSVRGDVVGVGSKLHFADQGTVGGDLTSVLGRLDINQAKVNGEITNINIGGPGWHSSFGMWPATWPLSFLGFLFFWWKLLEIALIFIVVVLMAALVPDRVRTISEEAPARPLAAFFTGLACYLGLFMLCITIIAIPVVYPIFKVLQWLGMAGLFHQTGVRLGRLLGREMSLLGGILLGLLPFALLRFLPFCIGSVLWFVLGAFAIGIVFLTRAGGRKRAVPAWTGPPVPPVAPVLDPPRS